MSNNPAFHQIENFIPSPYPGEMIASDLYNPSYRMAYRAVNVNTVPTTPASATIIGSGSKRFAQAYDANIATPGHMGSGLIKLHDYSYIGPCALPYDKYHQWALVGEPIFWGPDFAKWYCETHCATGTFNAEKHYRFASEFISQNRVRSVAGEHVILSAPGQDIYGHWLIDFIPKLYTLTQSETKLDSIYLEHIPKWAHIFLQAFELAPNKLKSHPAKVFSVESAIIPSSSKSGYRLGAQNIKNAWQHLNSQILPQPVPAGLSGEKIYLSRAQFSGSTRRSIVNATEVAQHFADRGYKVVAPERLSVAQQFQLMREARVVVGEDGSALHNIIFSNSGAKLGVLSLPERTNLWHAGICHILGHTVAFMDLPENETEDLSIPALASFLDELEG
ncbi:glycosyltransferase family 61 protein [Asticcacaulis excentricus]|uniref:Glycosyltransferase 61 catalytic domain-containing protein n=1 Tax=Asticcacaulis excentricus (strain ATCC 15261 / DSM 4724 / KCTC 12464 / NCIMB 9791 / VKM B-1370 / CB 48) TaxID=573065 RepID=E8RMQ2_ASTEC|nr:glycosyltransferase family 61 protein [Asticcacaulis excentricus]ADU13933.1 hypothetical protein Astex_2279 [Asticcacaulis excentricus CB 48]